MVAENATNFMPLLTTVGFGGIAGFLVGIAIRYIIKIIAVIAGLFLAASNVFTITSNTEC